jgi:porin
MKYRWIYGCMIGLWVCSLTYAQLPQIENYSGDFWSRPALTGDWGGLRNTLAKKGINLDVDLVQSLQGLNAGGSLRSQDSVLYRYGGYVDYRLNVDTGKLGLWPGGFLSLKAETQFASFLESGQTGALLAPNAAALYPVPFEETSALSSVVFTQFLAKWFGIYLGKIESSAPMRTRLRTTLQRSL